MSGWKLAVGYPWSSPFISTGFCERSLNMKAPDGCLMRWFRGTGWCPARRHISLCEQGHRNPLVSVNPQSSQCYHRP